MIISGMVTIAVMIDKRIVIGRVAICTHNENSDGLPNKFFMVNLFLKVLDFHIYFLLSKENQDQLRKRIHAVLVSQVVG